MTTAIQAAVERTLTRGAMVNGGMEPKLTAEEMRELMLRVQEIQTLEHLTDGEVGGIVGYSGPVINQLKKLKYRGDSQKVLKRLRKWLDERAAQDPMTPGLFVRTSIADLILGVCTRATRRQTIGLVITPAGVGKTEALRECARRLGDRCLLLVGGESCNSKTALAWELADRLGVSVPNRSGTAAVVRAVKKRLASLYAGGRAAPITILVDESTSIQPTAINLLRNLHDDPTTRCPLVLADTWRLDAQLHSQRGLPGGYEQLRSRAGAQVRWTVDRPIPLDDVRAVAESVLRSIDVSRRLPAASLRFLHEHVANRFVRDGGRKELVLRDGALRNVMQRLHAAADVAEAVGREPAFSVAELDYVAGLVGHAQEQPEAASPFDAGEMRKAV
ncbi:MAG TPA: ATP-binding protein [Phycisphaerae bacterium]|nr:ATP-binding protein [Phycisphaerae bacterium]